MSTTVIPSKTIVGRIVSFWDHAFWTESEPKTWEGATFQWVADIQIEAQTHGSEYTPEPFMYTGNDIKVGDWVTDIDGNSFLIREIISANPSSIQAVLEDVEQYNTYRDRFSSGYGGPVFGTCVFFELNEDGRPIIEGLPPGYFTDTFFSNIVGRFENRNVKTNYVRVLQTNHGFTVGDFIKVDDQNEGRFDLVNAAQADLAIGIVTEISGPSNEYFSYRPLGKLIEDVTPPLVGNYGDIFYIDPNNPGKVTNIKPAENAKPVYVRLDSENRAILLNISVDEDTIPVTLNVVPELDQTEFTLPSDAKTVVEMSINGIETSHFTFDSESKVLTFDPVATGYGLDPTDEVIFIYLS